MLLIFTDFKNINESAVAKVLLPKHVDMEKINREVAQPLLTLCSSELGVFISAEHSGACHL